MKNSFNKINRELCISDSSVNVFQYRCLTSGFQLKEVLKNPIGYFNHGNSDYPRDAGVLVKWDNFRIEDEIIFAKPIINISHPRGERTIDEIESGFLNAASVGKIVVLESSIDKNLMLPGQTKPTITKWFPREISVVDILGDYNAFPNLIDKDDNKYKLDHEISHIRLDQKIQSIEKYKILKILGLKDGGESEILSMIKNLVERSERIVGLQMENNKLKNFNDYQDKTFDELYASDKLEFVKNKYPQLYEKLKKENSIMIGDCIHADVLGAINCGMDAVLFSELYQDLEDKTIKQVNRLLDLKKYL